MLLGLITVLVAATTAIVAFAVGGLGSADPVVLGTAAVLVLVGGLADWRPLRTSDGIFSPTEPFYAVAALLAPAPTIVMLTAVGGTFNHLSSKENSDAPTRVRAVMATVNTAATVVGTSLAIAVTSAVVPLTGEPVGHQFAAAVAIAAQIGIYTSSLTFLVASLARSERIDPTRLRAAVAGAGIGLSVPVWMTAPVLLALIGHNPLLLGTVAPMLVGAYAYADRVVGHEHLLSTDRVTGLRNLAAFQTYVPTADTIGYLAIRDLASITDALGHAATELLVAEVGRAVQQELFGHQVASGGVGSFVVAINGDPAQAEETLRQARAALSAVHEVSGVPVAVELRCGAAIREPDEAIAGQILRARIAAERGRGEVVVHSSELPRLSRDDLALAADLRDAIRAGGLRAAYQPIYSGDGVTIDGVEALARWEHPEAGPVQPQVFIGLARRMGLVGELTGAMLRRVAADMADWAAQGVSVRVNVNVTAEDLAAGNLHDLIAEVFGSAGIPFTKLCVEMTEESVTVDAEATIKTLMLLRGMGCATAIDDFGTGQSSLARLTEFPFSELKIDRSLVDGVRSAPRRLELLSTLVPMGHRLGMTVTAEGVEHPGDVLALGSVGVDRLQGFGLSVPVEADEVARLIRRNGGTQGARATSSERT